VILAASLTIAILFGAGSYLLLQRDLIRVVVGIILVSNAANLFVISAGLSRGQAPIYPLEEGVEISDPLVQALTLTAIVIAFGIAALLMSLVYRVYTSHLSLDLEEISEAEVQEEERIESREVAED
jgi:multicomponent Na+:H+ antiporter subunit C